MLRFRCPNCSQKIKTRDDRAGTKGRCPRCKQRIDIPPAARVESPAELTLVGPPPRRVAKTMPVSERERLEAERLTAVQYRDEQVLASLGITPPTQHTGQRKYPWPIDVLLYPTNGAGLIAMALIGIAPVVLTLLLFIARFAGCLLVLPLLVVAFVTFLYAACYFAECVYDSAKGGTRAPSIHGTGGSIGDMWSRVSYLLAVYVLYALPLPIYVAIFRRADAITLTLALWFFVFFPIGHLAMVMFDSTSALNPFFLAGSILRTFLPYLGLLVLLGAVMVSLGLATAWISARVPRMLAWMIGLASPVYSTLVLAHVLGRFYWRYRERLDWGGVTVNSAGGSRRCGRGRRGPQPGPGG